ncbi:uncharacterized protein LOC110986276 [Acanthaster planci]|uniref:Uncharacterized protein LOC110986276 n=1 Tax=Acanthaster planci TaxID=133434 RepID=A0A8B7ZFE3_ACAPL|nr:uncharacterized protein LOC110986276 [Acanthaster planci]XP_022103717.1 uncharacterized protein LOC110986276 [Acanthaster planci]XP_022103718.1 uncharacterized protein LOC110986276 [Acanthaster planci]
MAGARSAHPRWLLDCKGEIVQTDEWKILTQELNQAVQQQLNESHVSKFTDLSDPEKQLFLERAAKAIQEGDAFQSFNQAASKTLDKHLSNHANQQLLNSSPLESKSELVLEQAREGALGLLKSWPGNKAKFRRFFNQALPDRLRQIAWRLYLRSPKVRSLYLEQLKADPSSVMSILDLEVVQTCEALLTREPTFQDLSNNTDILHAMKAILSYHHVCKKTKTSLIDTDYMLVIPFLLNVLSTTRPEQLVLESTLALLIEEYATFMSSRPIFMRESYVKDFQGSMEAFAKQIAGMLQEKDEALAEHFHQVFSGHFAGPSALTQGIKTLVRPMVRCLFVGYLSLDAVMYVWDQYIIGLDVPDYDIVPCMTVSVLMLQRKYLLQCESLPEMEFILKRNAVKLTKDELMYEIGHHFYQVLHHQLNSGQDGTPVLDPTQVAMPWEYWYYEMLPQRTKAEDRRRERNIRKDQRQREKDAARDEEMREKLRKEEEEMEEIQNSERMARFDQQRLRDLLEQEKRKRAKAEREAQAEISQLKLEIARLKQVKPALLMPTLTPQECARPPEMPASGPESKILPTRQLEDPHAASSIMADILKDFVDGARRLQGHGSAAKATAPGTSSQ